MANHQPFQSLSVTPTSGHLDKAFQKECVYDIYREKGYSHLRARLAAHHVVEKCARATGR